MGYSRLTEVWVKLNKTTETVGKIFQDFFTIYFSGFSVRLTRHMIFVGIEHTYKINSYYQIGLLTLNSSIFNVFISIWFQRFWQIAYKSPYYEYIFERIYYEKMFAFNNSSQVQEREKGLGDEVTWFCISILQPFDNFNLDISI